MGNIIGEGFKPYVIDQIDQRQKRLGREKRTNERLQEQNSKSAWVKLTSSILIADRSKFGPQVANEEDIAKKYTLFGGTSIDLNPLGGLNAYTKFGFEQGYRPMPGILSLETKNRNRGSVRETTIQIRAYSREQFYYIDLLYLRLGYSVLVEFGNSLYYDNSGKYQKFTDAQTVTADFLGKEVSKYKGNHYALVQAIEKRREETAGNYDAVFGQVRNFDWSFTPEGYYDITLSVISYGDVIESLKANVQASNNRNTPLTQEEKESAAETEQNLSKATRDEEVIDILKNLDIIGNLAWKIKNALAFNSTQKVNLKDGSIAYLKTPTPVFDSPGYLQQDAVRLPNQEENSSNYYIRFGALLQYLWEKGMLYVDKERTKPVVAVDLSIADNLIYKTPYTLSANPNICIVKTNLELSINGANFGTSILKDLPQEFSFDVDGRNDAGKILNVYLDLAYVVKQCNSLKDSNNNIFFYDLIKKLCDSVGQCLGGVNTLEPVVDEQEFRLYILDQHPIPSIQQEPRRLAEFSIYGLTPGQQGSFVTDFGIRTSITNALASTVTIGAQADGAVKGADATVFATWNAGLVDRVLLYKQNKDSDPTSELQSKTNLQVKNRQLQEEYYRFVKSMQAYEWNDGKTNEFQTILSNMLSFTEVASGITGEGTKGGSLGFLPINLNLTFDGLSGMKIYQRFKVDQDFLPYNYPNTLQFIITGITHQVSNNKWTTTLETNVVPETITTNASQDFTGLEQPTATAGSGTDTAATQNTGALAFPASTSTGVRLQLFRKSDNGVQTIGELRVLSATGAILQTYNTVERPWKENQSRISCIPPGTYRFVKSKAGNNPKLKDVLRLSNPRYRDGILVHVGNKPTDSEGCILPNKNGISTAAMSEILDKLYPAGAPNQTYSIEIYGVPGKQYVDLRDDTVYQNPRTARTSADLEKSRKLYIEYAGRINVIMSLSDNYDVGAPLLQNTTSSFFTNATAEAAKRIQAVFGSPNMNIDSRPAPWNNLLELNELVPEHQKLFKQELRIFAGAVQSRGSSLKSLAYTNFRTYRFKYPDLGDKVDQFISIPVTY